MKINKVEMTGPEYTELFALRGGAYDSAMRRWPDARAQEFAQAIQRCALATGMVVADVPAGGGYLRRYLPSGCRWLGHEPCETFGAGADGHGAAHHDALLPLPWPDASVDAAISLAGLHHMEDKQPLFAELRRVVRPGGRLVVSDVAQGSAVAGFLDDYVGAHNSTGHQGAYLCEKTHEELAAAGWRVVSSERVAFHWVFADRSDMAAFCHRLFDLRTSSPQDTLAAIESRLGTDELPGGGVGMRWELMTIVVDET